MHRAGGRGRKGDTAAGPTTARRPSPVASGPESGPEYRAGRPRRHLGPREWPVNTAARPAPGLRPRGGVTQPELVISCLKSDPDGAQSRGPYTSAGLRRSPGRGPGPAHRPPPLPGDEGPCPSGWLRRWVAARRRYRRLCHPRRVSPPSVSPVSSWAARTSSAAISSRRILTCGAHRARTADQGHSTRQSKGNREKSSRESKDTEATRRLAGQRWLLNAPGNGHGGRVLCAQA